MVKKWECRIYFLVKILLVKLKNLHTSACLNLNYGTAKQKPKMVELIKTRDQYPHKINFGHFFHLFHSFLPPFRRGKTDFQKFCLGRWVISFCLGGDDKNQRDSFA